MDAIECGIVKLPRVPVADNIPGGETPRFRNLWEHIRSKMPKRGRGKAGGLDPLSLPVELQTALDALYGHYEKTFEAWRQAGIEVPPCFIVVCNNTSTSKLVHDYIAGFSRENEDGSTRLVEGRLERPRQCAHPGPAPDLRTRCSAICSSTPVWAASRRAKPPCWPFFPISSSGATSSKIRRRGVILPTKHIRPDRCLIGLGGEVIGTLERPMTMSKLWDAIRRRRSTETGSPVVDYRWFVLTLDFLYTIHAIGSNAA